MQPAKRISTHPGVILLEEFLRPLGVTQVFFARHIVRRVTKATRGPVRTA